MPRRFVVSLVVVALATMPLLRLPAARAADEPKKDLTPVPVPAGPVAKGKSLYGNSYALIIGINGYPNLPQRLWLRYAVADALALQRELIRSYGFKAENVRVLTDAEATEKNIRKALSSLANLQKVQPEDRLLVYFSGHGQDVQLPGRDGKMGFLLPYDADVDLNKLDNPAPFLESCLQMDTVWSYLEASAAKHVLLIADACYSGFLAKSRSVKDEELGEAALESLARQRARQVITAGRSGEQSFELPELGHGAFTGKLLDALRQRAEQPGQVFTATQLFSSVDAGVRNVTQGRQSPQIASYGSAEGQFLFVTDGRVPGPGEVTVGREQDDTVARAFVRTDPPGARIYLNGVEVRGMRTPATVPVSLGGERSKTVTITVDLDGVRRTSQVALVSGKLQEVPILRLEIAAVPPRPSPPAAHAEGSLEADIAAGFSPARNPNGAWVYGSLAPGATPNRSTFQAFTGRSRDPSGYATVWGRQGLPGVLNVSGPTSPDSFFPGWIQLCPGPRGEYCVARWTVPADGSYRISAAFAPHPQATVEVTTDVHVLHNSRALFDAWLVGLGVQQTKSANITIDAAAGDTLDFVVGWGHNRDPGWDITMLGGRIERVSR